MNPQITGNPLKITIYLMIISYFIGEFILPKYSFIYLINLIGILGIIISIIFFFFGFNLFNSYRENPLPNSDTNRLIKTGIFAYTRNPIYISFVLFHLSMFFVFGNVAYFLSSIGLFIWIDKIVIKKKEIFLNKKFGDEYIRYCNAVKRWLFF